jgi:hypothetical protein
MCVCVLLTFFLNKTWFIETIHEENESAEHTKV